MFNYMLSYLDYNVPFAYIGPISCISYFDLPRICSRPYKKSTLHAAEILEKNHQVLKNDHT